MTNGPESLSSSHAKPSIKCKAKWFNRLKPASREQHGAKKRKPLAPTRGSHHMDLIQKNKIFHAKIQLRILDYFLKYAIFSPSSAAMGITASLNLEE